MSEDKYEYIGKEVPIGLVIAILAAKNGAKKVVLATSMNHHQHPMSAAIDHIRGFIDIAGSKVAFMQVPDYSQSISPSGLKDWEAVKEKLFGKPRRERTAEEIINNG